MDASFEDHRATIGDVYNNHESQYYKFQGQHVIIFDHYIEDGDLNISVRYTMNFSLVSMQRQVYNVFNMLEDIGGF